MYVFFRLFVVMLTARFKPRHGPLDEIRTPIWIWPNDLDFNLHVNNGRYLTLCDIGRMDMTARTGLWRVMLTRRWMPVLSAAMIRFRRPVQAFRRMDFITRIIYWDEKWFYIEHRIEKGGEVYARAMVKGLFRGPEGNIPIAKLMETAGFNVEAPAEPEGVAMWRKLEDSLNQGF